ncbi:hypothetical protein HC752_04380 [Vibrio sp. S9_S30]|uniref:hypothetical protein n=1 Tax=Vibrio sp. S9_S30 TaxID=2720226 RepID=UPI0016818187|nr:hypothetical protein [Vibrio sp. S9_S30]MBD1556165.1 hypothetical protein [Vibrio sp. S9_S30]
MSAYFKKSKGVHKGSVSIEFLCILPALLILILSTADLLRILRLEQKITDLNYNILQMVSSSKTLDSQAEIEQFHLYQRFVDNELGKRVAGEASVQIETFDRANNKRETLFGTGVCRATANWPNLATGTLIRVTLCYEVRDTNTNLIWRLWPEERFQSHFVQEVR